MRYLKYFFYIAVCVFFIHSNGFTDTRNQEVVRFSEQSVRLDCGKDSYRFYIKNNSSGKYIIKAKKNIWPIGSKKERIAISNELSKYDMLEIRGKALCDTGRITYISINASNDYPSTMKHIITIKYNDTAKSFSFNTAIVE